MKRNIISAILPAALLAMSLAACGSPSVNTPVENPAAETTAVSEEAAEAVTEEASAEETAAEAATASAAAEEDVKVKNKEYTLSVPAAYKDLLIIETPEADENGILFAVYEKASVDAEKAQEGDIEGAGWLFSIGTENEQHIYDKLCEDMSGEDVFAVTEGGTYYVKYHPTDVRFVREEYTDIEKDMEQWSRLNEWAATVPETFVRDNEGLTLEKHSNTELDQYLARIAYRDDVDYTLEAAQYGVLKHGDEDVTPYATRMIKGVTYSFAEIEKAPDGEYIAMEIPGDHVRYDFFFAEEGQNYIRESREVDGETYETFYEAEFTDDTYTANEIMNDWYLELVDYDTQAIPAY